MKRLDVATRGHPHAFALVDDDVFDEVCASKWSVSAAGYVFRQNADDSWIYLHRVITAAAPGEVVDHVNGSKLDNRRENLRIATTIENSVNRRGSAKFRGVDQIPSTGRWRARIAIGGGRAHIGVFATAEEAARAYDERALAEWGDFAYLNFPRVVELRSLSREELEIRIIELEALVGLR